MSTKVEDNKELERIKKTFKTFKIAIILIDILALAILFIQIKMKDVAYYSYILLIICNLVVFLIKPTLIINNKDKK